MKNFKFKMVFIIILVSVFFPVQIFAQGAEGGDFNVNSFQKFWFNTGFANLNPNYLIMILIGLLFIYLGIAKKWQPVWLLPVGFGILIGNIPLISGFQIGIFEDGSVLNILYGGISQGWLPALIFLGIGAITDFSALISNPKLLLLGAAGQLGIFVTILGAYHWGFSPVQSVAMGIIGAGDVPTSIFLSSHLAPELVSSVALSAYAFIALLPFLQKPFMKLLTTDTEKRIKMKQPRQVTRIEKIIFPIVGLLLTTFISPNALPLLGMLFLGNLLKESGVTEHLAETARTALFNTALILMGLLIGATAQGDIFLTSTTLKIFVIGAISIVVASSGGILLVKFMNLFLKNESKINPLIGSAGIAAIPGAARVAHEVGLKYDNTNHLLSHAVAPNVAGLIGSAMAAGILLGMFA